MDDPHSIRQIIWGRLWDIVQDVHENSDKSGNLTLEQEKADRSFRSLFMQLA
jgi:hypothetical protein